MHLRSIAIAFVILISGCTHNSKKDDPESSNEPPPKMMSPLVKKIWVPAAIKNGGLEWESGHFLYRIERQPTWSR